MPTGPASGRAPCEEETKEGHGATTSSTFCAIKILAYKADKGLYALRLPADLTVKKKCFAQTNNTVCTKACTMHKVSIAWVFYQIDFIPST